MLNYGQWYVRNVLVEKEKGGYICRDDLINLCDGGVKLIVHSVSSVLYTYWQTEFCSTTVSAGEISVKWDMLLTYSMVQSPSWEANWLAASQEIPRISQNPKVHYRTHKHSPPVSILG
jgi:hypothetical protein